LAGLRLHPLKGRLKGRWFVTISGNRRVTFTFAGKDAAQGRGASRQTPSAVLSGRAGIGPEMAVRRSIAFGTPAASWLNQQVQSDLWLAEKRRSSRRVARSAA